MSKRVRAANKGISKARRKLKKYERERVNRAERRKVGAATYEAVESSPQREEPE